MKNHLLTILFIALLFNISFAQTGDMEAQYEFIKAEKAYSNDKYYESINHCDEAAAKLGKINSKILYLKLKCYENLIRVDCIASILKFDTSISMSLQKFFEVADSNYPKEKYIEMIDLKKNYQELKEKGCPKKIKENPNDNLKEKYTITNIYDEKIKGLNGEIIDFTKFKGKKILIVNTASECGYTPQYEKLEELYQTHKDKLVVIGFPANNFGNQEPGGNAEILRFCKKNYGVSFPMAEKVSVKGLDIDPLFKYLTDEAEKLGILSPIKWNFTKFLIDENGNLITVFPSKVGPMSEEITSKL